MELFLTRMGINTWASISCVLLIVEFDFESIITWDSFRWLLRLQLYLILLKVQTARRCRVVSVWDAGGLWLASLNLVHHRWVKCLVHYFQLFLVLVESWLRLGVVVTVTADKITEDCCVLVFAEATLQEIPSAKMVLWRHSSVVFRLQRVIVVCWNSWLLICLLHQHAWNPFLVTAHSRCINVSVVLKVKSHIVERGRFLLPHRLFPSMLVELVWAHRRSLFLFLARPVSIE